MRMGPLAPLLLLACAFCIPLRSGAAGSGTAVKRLLSDANTTADTFNYDVLPDWAVPRLGEYFARELARDVAAIAAADATGRRMDLVIYGDSITAWHKPVDLTKLKGSREVWNRYFGDWLAEPLGVPGDRIAQVVWRLAEGGEKPALDPKVVVLFIGINDGLKKTVDAEGQMEYLLGWVRARMPTSRVVVQALLPSHRSGETLNVAWQKLAMQYGAAFSTCGQDIPRNDRRWMVDFLHPNIAGQRRLLACLRRLVEPMVDAANGPDSARAALSKHLS